jgi:hypothetical protein
MSQAWNNDSPLHIFLGALNLRVRFISFLRIFILVIPLSQISSQISQKKICPRCGQPYSYIEEIDISRRSYLYAVHYVKDENGKRKKKRCYLGPKEGYEYVSKTHDIIFYGLDRQDRYIRYLEEIIDLFDVDEPVSSDLDDFRKDFKNMIKMKSLLKRISNRVEERLEKIIQTMISDIKASIDVLKRDYSKNPQALELVKELEAFDREIEKCGLEKSYKSLKDEALRSYVERYLQLKNKMKMFNI